MFSYVKKMLAILLATVLIVMAMPLSALADDAAYAANCAASVTEANAGDEVTVTVSVDTLSAAALAIVLGTSYDADVFEFVSGEWLLSDGLMADVDAEKQNAVIGYASAVEMSGDVFSYTLRVKADAACGTSTIQPSVVVGSNGSRAEAAVTGVTVGIINHAWTDATCSAPKTCSVCGATEGTAVDHVYVDGACQWCGEEDPNASVEEGTVVATTTMGTVTLAVYELADGSHKLVVSGTGAAPVWNTKAIYTNYASTIKTIVIKEGITNIAYGAYKGMAALESVSLPSTLTVINGTAFQNCAKLSSINLDEGLTTINYAAFLGTGLTELTIPNSVTTMGKNVFQNCKKLTKVTFGASKLNAKTIPARTFSGCTALKTVDFGSRLQLIDDYAFNQCGIENLYLPANIKTVDNAAFYKCASLKTIEIADGGATYLGWASFYSCPKLQSIDLGNSLKTISTWVFTACNSLKEVTVPNTVNNIGRRTFSWCKALETVVLSDGMTDVKQELFYGSTALKNVTLPANLTAIGAKAFYKCIALTELEIPEGVTVGANAFTGSGIK